MSGGFLDRWSRRKLASAGKALLADSPPSGVPLASAEESSGQGDLAPAPLPGAEVAVPSAAEAHLPPVEGLTLASDFTAFLKEEVSETLRRQALHKLFADPHFNRMDGLDIYIDDYSLPDPIPPEAMAKLKHAREWLMARETEVDESEAVEAEAAKDDAPAGQADADAVGAEGGRVEGASAKAPDEVNAQSESAPQGATAKAGDDAVPTISPSPAHEAIESGQKAP